jgi:glutathione S-transferase
VHIGFAQVWRAERFTDDLAIHPAIQDGGHAALSGFFAEIDGLVGDGWTVGDRFTAVDSYFLVFFRWGGRIGSDMAAFPRWAGLARRVAERPAVQRTLATEGYTPEDFIAAR